MLKNQIFDEENVKNPKNLALVIIAELGHFSVNGVHRPLRVDDLKPKTRCKFKIAPAYWACNIFTLI